MNNIIDLIEKRRSVARYENSTISPEDIAELVRLATLSPSAYNFQNWHFVAVTENEAKQKLHQAAYEQPQVLQAATTLIVIGELNAHRSLAKRLQQSVDNDILPQEVADAWAEAAANSHEGNPQVQREEEKIRQEFDLTDDQIPVMLITLGKGAAKGWQQKIRRPVDEVLTLV
jgi:nitroreductase